MSHNNLHSFNLTDAQILLALAAANKGVDVSCAALIAACAGITDQVPSLVEFAQAFNKFLYISAIQIEGHRLSLVDFGRTIIQQAQYKASISGATNLSAAELALWLLKELSGYKLKSMCNRNVWTQEQYQQVVAEQRVLGLSKKY